MNLSLKTSRFCDMSQITYSGRSVLALFHSFCGYKKAVFSPSLFASVANKEQTLRRNLKYSHQGNTWRYRRKIYGLDNLSLYTCKLLVIRFWNFRLMWWFSGEQRELDGCWCRWLQRSTRRQIQNWWLDHCSSHTWFVFFFTTLLIHICICRCIYTLLVQIKIHMPPSIRKICVNLIHLG